MSERTPCNFCALAEIRRRYGAGSVTVTLADGDLAGWLAVRVAGRDEPVAWFLALSDACAC